MPSLLNDVLPAVVPAARRQPYLPFVPPLVRRLTARAARRVGADAAYLALACAAWAVGNALAILGAMVAALLVISGGDVDVFFAHLNNLARRYVEADVGRREAFQHQLAQLFVVLALLLFLVRTPRFAARLRQELREERR